MVAVHTHTPLLFCRVLELLSVQSVFLVAYGEQCRIHDL